MRRRLISMIALVCALPGMMAGMAGCAVGGESEHFRVMSYNIHHGEGMDGRLDLERIAALIVDADPDLVALQEVDFRTGRTGGVDQAETLAELTGMHSAFAKFMDYEGGEYGLAVLSKTPIENFERIQLPPGLHEPRAALSVRTKPTGCDSAVVFVSLHFDWLSDDAERLAQARSLLEQLRDESGTVILAGDFNDTPESRTMALIFGSFANAAKPVEDRFTFSSVEPRKEIDFVVFRTAGVMMGESRVLDEPVASDHRPIVADFVISP